MTYCDAITFLFSSLPVFERTVSAYKPGLERVAGFAEKLGDPHKKFATIHIAGTNGKGSTAHMLAAVLQKSSLKTGLFTSPHLVDFRERIRVDGEMIPEAAVVEFTELWREEMVRAGLTFFEMATVMALWWFERVGCDVAVIETGLGGRLDSTNIITPVLGVITNIGLEHTDYLGDTIAKIAAEKAGIIKPGVPVVVGEADDESEPVFRTRAMEMGAEIVFANAITNYSIDLQGDYQRKNVATVLAAIEILRRTFDISDEAIEDGLARAALLTGLMGRWQIIGYQPLVVCDTAHNAHGFREVVGQIAAQKRDKLYMVLGFAADKDLAAIVPLLPREAHYILTAADTPRAMPPEKLAEKINCELQITNYEIVPKVAKAVEKARALAGPRDFIYIGGSNFVVGEYLGMLKT